MSSHDKDYEIVDNFLEETQYQCNESTRDFIAKRYPSKLLDDIWDLIAYKEYTEESAILKIQENLVDSKSKWEGTKPFTGFIAFEIAKKWIKETDSNQWVDPDNEISKKLVIFFEYAVKNAVYNTKILNHLLDKYKNNWDVAIGETLCISLHIKNSQIQLNKSYSTIRNYFRSIFRCGYSYNKVHQKLCSLALEYYESEEDKFIFWVKNEHPNDYISHYSKSHYSYLTVLIKDMCRDNAVHLFSESEWMSASKKCKRQMLVGWADKRQFAEDIAKYHTTEEENLLNKAKETLEDAEYMLEAAQTYMEYVKAIASGATGMSLPPTIRIKGKLYDRYVHPSIVIKNAEQWVKEAQNDYKKLLSIAERKVNSTINPTEYSEELSNIINERNQLSIQLNTLINRARDNEQQQNIFEKLSLEVISTRSLSELLNLLFEDIPKRFKWDSFSMVIIDEVIDMESMIKKDDIFNKYRDKLSFKSLGDENISSLPIKSITGQEVIEKYNWAFNQAYNNELLASAIYVPLYYNSILEGAMFIGSRNKLMFRGGLSTTFFDMFSKYVQIQIMKQLELLR